MPVVSSSGMCRLESRNLSIVWLFVQLRARRANLTTPVSLSVQSKVFYRVSLAPSGPEVSFQPCPRVSPRLYSLFPPLCALQLLPAQAALSSLSTPIFICCFFCLEHCSDSKWLSPSLTPNLCWNEPSLTNSYIKLLPALGTLSSSPTLNFSTAFTSSWCCIWMYLFIKWKAKLYDGRHLWVWFLSIVNSGNWCPIHSRWTIACLLNEQIESCANTITRTIHVFLIWCINNFQQLGSTIIPIFFFLAAPRGM